MNATKNYTAIRVDFENNAETWWEALDESCPKIAAALRRDNHAVVTREVLDELADLPGFDDGPDFAQTALIDCGGEGDMWADVVGSRHKVFERAE